MRGPRLLLWITALLPALLVLAFDTLSRREIFIARAGPPIGGYIGGAALSLALWGLGLEAARHPRLAVRVAALVLLGLTAAFGIGGQLLFHTTAHEYFNRDAVIFSINLLPIILDYLLQNPVANGVVVGGAATLAVSYAIFRHRRAGPRRRFANVAAVLGLAACLFTAFGPFRVPAQKHGLPPDVLFWHAAGGLGLYAIGVIPKPKTLPPGQHVAPPQSVRPVSKDAPSIVLIFGESVRRDEVCAFKSADCDKSPRLDAAAPERIGFARSFAVASCTEVSSAILWSGLPITASTEAIQAAPLLWDYARSRGYRTAYLTSQNLAFQDQGLFLRTSQIDEKREARDRMKHADLDIGSPDEQSAAEALAFLAKDGPGFVVLHFSNTHLPYRQVPGMTPNQGQGDGADARRARYLNSLVFQDATIGDFLDQLRKTERGKKAIVIYSADHGEAWGEHDSFTHTFDLYAEQINVPLWVDAPEGTLSDTQRAELSVAAAARPVFTPDVSATVLDLLGALDDPGCAEPAKKLAGASVLRPAPVQRDMEISNCPPFRGCFPEAWGLVRWPLKHHFIGRELQSVCSNLETDPAETSPVSPAACADLRASILARYPPRPDRSYPPAPTGASPPAPTGATPAVPSAMVSATPSASASAVPSGSAETVPAGTR